MFSFRCPSIVLKALWEGELIGSNDCGNVQLNLFPPQVGRVGNQRGGENPNGIMESYHFLTGEDLYATAKANGLK